MSSDSVPDHLSSHNTDITPTTHLPEPDNYHNLLKRLYQQLHKDRPESKLVTTKINIARPIMGKIGGRVTKWCNFHVMCEKIHRTPEHVAAYIAKELCTTYSLTSTNDLKIRYKLESERACLMFSKYMNEFVRCTTCKSLHTVMTKHPVYRFYVIHCESCLSENTANNGGPMLALPI